MKSAFARSWAALGAAGLALAMAQPLSAQGGAPAGCTGKPSATWITVTIDGLRNANGVVALTLYPDEPAKFLKPGGSLQVGRTPARTGTFQTCTYVPAPGTYGLVLYHDENSNGKVDRNGLGIPKEGFGFSNNPSIFFSAPSFKRVRFAVSGPGVAIRIKMKYP